MLLWMKDFLEMLMERSSERAVEPESDLTCRHSTVTVDRWAATICSLSSLCSPLLCSWLFLSACTGPGPSLFSQPSQAPYAPSSPCRACRNGPKAVTGPRSTKGPGPG